MTHSQPEAILRPTSPAISGTKGPLVRFMMDDSGQDLIEYALVAALIGLSAATAMKGLSTKISSSFNTIGSNLTSGI